MRQWDNIVDEDTIQERRELADESNRKLLQRDLYAVGTSPTPKFTGETANKGSLADAGKLEACEQILAWIERLSEMENETNRKKMLGAAKKRFLQIRSDWYE